MVGVADEPQVLRAALWVEGGAGAGQDTLHRAGAAEEGGDLYLINGNMTKLKDAGAFANMGSAAKGKEEDDDNDQQKNKARNPC